ncbi:hypothetical protein [Arthrobacter sp. B3I4]|uniref:hypothetical protein n=1 Tax=Arthrobacter sp. B3I4 TaxID=3042267 RepID=UPI002786A57F|nr:hypothetical protein [Arthrobacter sp. B3I4]MDQ0756730.1 hypothetical protein [Arthrobacter sp. B3I4]
MADAPASKPGAAVPVRGLPERGRVLCRGFIESVTYAPAGKVAAFTAMVTDHDAPPTRARAGHSTAVPGAQSGVQSTAQAGARRKGTPVAADRLRVIWLGRRRIPGVNAGLELRLEGMVTVRDGLPTMFNPRYEILSRQEEQ